MPVTNHELHNEFPQHSHLIDDLMARDNEFQEKVRRYSALDREIEKLEKNDVPTDDHSFNRMKTERAHLKDWVYSQLVKQAS